MNPELDIMRRTLWGLFQICMVQKSKIDEADFTFPLMKKKDFEDLVDSIESRDKETLKKIMNQYENERNAFLRKDPLNEMQSLDKKDAESFNSMGKYCSFLLDAFDEPTRYPEIISSFYEISTSAVACVFEMIGYWKAKMEEKRRNTESVKVRTQKKEEKKKEIRKMLETTSPNDGDVAKQVRLRAMRLFGCTEGNVRSLMREIESEM